MPEQSGQESNTLREPTFQELITYLLIIGLCDFTIFRGHGFSGYAAAMIMLPGLLLLGAPRARFSIIGAFLWMLLIALAIKGVWCATPGIIFCAIILVGAFAYSLTGHVPHLIETIAFMLQAFVGGYVGLLSLAQQLVRANEQRRSTSRWINVGLPVGTCVVFAGIFVLANPNLADWVSARFQDIGEDLRRFLQQFTVGEVIFWGITLWISVGLLRPLQFRETSELLATPSRKDESGPFVLMIAYRNTLAAVVALFAVYLAFEFQSLWFRTFPQGFHYSGYAHRGAAWLTVALALATSILSLIFRGPVLLDSRLPGLRKLAWMWSFENFILAIAVYHRLLIYVGYNGMTYMRMIGFLGITCVVVGFLLVVAKIALDRHFLWLIRRQLAALGLAVVFFVCTPVDWIVMDYNVSQIRAGNVRPSVQISVHSYSAEGWLRLVPLSDCQDSIIRNGVRAMLARRQIVSRELNQNNQSQGWTSVQLAGQLLLTYLDRNESQWTVYKDDLTQRDEAIAVFDRYVYQWY